MFFLEIIYQKKKDGAYIINLDEYSDIGTHWVALYVNNNNNNNNSNNNNNANYFDSFGVEHIPKEIKTFFNRPLSSASQSMYVKYQHWVILCFEWVHIKINEIITKFLLAGDKFMPEMHIKQLVFTYSACGSFTKNKERIQKSKETGDTSYIYKNDLDK